MSRYIDADILKDKTTRVNNIWNGTTNAEGKGLDEIIDDIPTADVRKNVKGKWRIEYTGDGWNDYIDVTCTNCGKTIKRGEPYNFCPNCGADMRGEA